MADFFPFSCLAVGTLFCYLSFTVSSTTLSKSSFCVLITQSSPTLCDPMDCSPAKLLSPWNSPDKNTGLDCHSLLQGISSTQRSNPGLLYCRQILYCLSHQGSPANQIIPPHFLPSSLLPSALPSLPSSLLPFLFVS